MKKINLLKKKSTLPYKMIYSPYGKRTKVKLNYTE